MQKVQKKEKKDTTCKKYGRQIFTETKRNKGFFSLEFRTWRRKAAVLMICDHRIAPFSDRQTERKKGGRVCFFLDPVKVYSITKCCSSPTSCFVCSRSCARRLIGRKKKVEVEAFDRGVKGPALMKKVWKKTNKKSFFHWTGNFWTQAQFSSDAPTIPPHSPQPRP